MAEPPGVLALMEAVRPVTDVVSPGPTAAGGLLVGVSDLEGLGELREPPRNIASRTRTERLRRFEHGDLVLSAGRTEQPKVWLADRDGFCTRSLTVLRPTGRLDPRHLLWALRALYTDRAGSRVDLRRERVELPRAVGDPRVAVDVLDQINAAMKLRRRTLASIEHLGPALFHDRFGDPLDRSGVWPVRELGELIEKIETGWSPKCIDRPARDGDWGVIKVSAVSSGRFRAHENKTLPVAVEPRRQLALKAGDLLIVRSNTRALVGTTAVVPEDHPQLLLSDKVWRLRLSEGLDTRFMKTTLSYPSVRERLSRIATGNIASMQNLTQHKLRELSVVLPPHDTQTEHVVDLALLNRVESAHQRQVALLERLLRVVLAKLLFGRRHRRPGADSDRARALSRAFDPAAVDLADARGGRRRVDDARARPATATPNGPTVGRRPDATGTRSPDGRRCGDALRGRELATLGKGAPLRSGRTLVRIRRLRLVGFRGLHDVSIHCREPMLDYRGVDVRFLVGRNGSGKSTALEALALIFSHLAVGAHPGFDFELEYELHGAQVRLTTLSAAEEPLGEIHALRRAPGEEDYRSVPLGSSNTVLLPDRVVGYSTGPTSGMGDALFQSIQRLEEEIRIEEGEDEDELEPSGAARRQREAFMADPQTLFLDTGSSTLPALAALAAHSRDELVSDVLAAVELHPERPLLSFSLSIASDWDALLPKYEHDQLRAFLELAELGGMVTRVEHADDGGSHLLAAFDLGSSFVEEKLPKLMGTPLRFLETLVSWSRRGVLQRARLVLRKLDLDEPITDADLSDGELFYLSRYALLRLASKTRREPAPARRARDALQRQLEDRTR